MASPSAVTRQIPREDPRARRAMTEKGFHVIYALQGYGVGAIHGTTSKTGSARAYINGVTAALSPGEQVNLSSSVTARCVAREQESSDVETTRRQPAKTAERS